MSLSHAIIASFWSDFRAFTVLSDKPLSLIFHPIWLWWLGLILSWSGVPISWRLYTYQPLSYIPSLAMFFAFLSVGFWPWTLAQYVDDTQYHTCNLTMLLSEPSLEQVCSLLWSHSSEANPQANSPFRLFDRFWLASSHSLAWSYQMCLILVFYDLHDRYGVAFGLLLDQRQATIWKNGERDALTPCNNLQALSELRDDCHEPKLIKRRDFTQATRECATILWSVLPDIFQSLFWFVGRTRYSHQELALGPAFVFDK